MLPNLLMERLEMSEDFFRQERLCCPCKILEEKETFEANAFFSRSRRACIALARQSVSSRKSLAFNDRNA